LAGVEGAGVDEAGVAVGVAGEALLSELLLESELPPLLLLSELEELSPEGLGLALP
jgi:hypothetical protein